MACLVATATDKLIGCSMLNSIFKSQIVHIAVYPLKQLRWGTKNRKVEPGDKLGQFLRITR